MASQVAGLLQQKLYADGHGICYNYTDDGKLLTRIWARGVTTTYTYDGWNQLTNTDYSDGTPSVTLAYDAMGRQASATDAAGTTTFAYTDYGEPLSETWGGLGNRVLLRHYDSFGRGTGYSVGGTRKTTLGYDSATGRLSTMNEGGNFTWNYLPGSDLKSRVVYPNGVTVDYTYEQNRDLLTNVHNHLGDTTYSEYAYTNDALGRRAAKNAETYGYNDRNELIIVAGFATASLGASMIASLGTTGVGAAAGFAVMALGADQIAGGINSIYSQFTGGPALDSTPIKESYTTIARTITGRKGSDLEYFFSSVYISAELLTTCYGAFISARTTYESVRIVFRPPHTQVASVEVDYLVKFTFQLKAAAWVVEGGEQIFKFIFGIAISGSSNIPHGTGILDIDEGGLK